MNIGFPFRFDSRGRTALDSDDDHISGMIRQILFTRPGERVNRPDFGSGIMQLVFAPDNVELAAAVQFSIQAGLQQYLGDLIEVRAVKVSADDSTLTVNLLYIVRHTSTPVTAQFTSSVS
ncbi:MAG TPA: GPW/gp25 family protein [Bryobacteraceae bacterium]|nr:GPW/gp25 family protein [Bryobacteraceae bacterium]